MLKQKIGIDIDEVIADSSAYWTPKINKKFNLNLTIQDITDYYLENVIKDIDPKEIINFIISSNYTDDFHENIKPIPNAISVIKKLKNNNFNIYYISFRPGETKQKSKNWLIKHGFMKYSSGIYHAELFPTENKTPKKEIASLLKLDYFIDDSIENIEKLSEISTLTCILMDKPWNQKKISKNVIRVNNWIEIEKFLLYK